MNLLSWLLGLFRRKPAPPPAPPPAPAPAPPGEGWRGELLGLVNRVRFAAGSILLTPDYSLDVLAQAQSARMAAAGRLFHGPTDEVVGAGQRSPAEIVEGWLGSAGHRQRLLDPNYRRVGFGRAVDAAGITYWCGDFQ